MHMKMTNTRKPQRRLELPEFSRKKGTLKPVSDKGASQKAGPSRLAKYRYSLARRSSNLRHNIDNHVWDVRLVSWLISVGVLVLVTIGLEYSRVRGFIDAWSGGYCSIEERFKRGALCTSSCKWYNYEIRENEAYCRGCDCPKWRGSRLKVKLRLARFRCPQGKFGRVPGMWHRLRDKVVTLWRP